jgi:hypothetical protein
LLRVFSLGRRSERLFDALATHWRHVGNIRLIAGPDLATTTVEPHEFLGFLSGRLARRFIDGPETLDLRLSETDLEPDPDGRFRVSDYFCYDDTWLTVLSRLADESDAVLMDLRGFTPQNRGVTHEINVLVDDVQLGQVVFVTDRHHRRGVPAPDSAGGVEQDESGLAEPVVRARAAPPLPVHRGARRPPAPAVRPVHQCRSRVPNSGQSLGPGFFPFGAYRLLGGLHLLASS